MSKYNSVMLKINDTQMCVHQWFDPTNLHNIFYFHGLQSHGGWSKELGEYLVSSGINLFISDRRGSGLSDGMRGHIPNRYTLLLDYRMVIKKLSESVMKDGYWLLGQSFGASVLSSYLSEYDDDECIGSIFVAPALGQVRLKNDQAKIFSWDCCSLTEYSHINLPTSHYTKNIRYAEMIDRDELNIREITISTRKTMLELDNSYLSVKLNRSFPVHLMVPETDLINNIEISESALASFFTNDIKKHIFNTDEHYLEYSSVNDEYFLKLSNVIKNSVIYD